MGKYQKISFDDLSISPKQRSILLQRITTLEKANFRMMQEKRKQEQTIASLERKLHQIGAAEEQRDWLLDELTKKITTIGEIRSDLIKRERLYAIGELSARLAHDMRNPLAIILNTLDLLKIKHSDELSQDVLRLLHMMDKATSRMAFQIDDVLNFIRNAPLEIEKMSLLQIISSSLYRIVVPDKVSIDAPKNDVLLECDPRKLEAIFSNLLMNSIQAMKNDGTIILKLFENEIDVTIHVQDSGPGISADIQQKIFDPLFTTKSRGTGLGLATVKNIVEQHNGYIRVYQNPTVFEIVLPKAYIGKNSDE